MCCKILEMDYILDPFDVFANYGPTSVTYRLTKWQLNIGVHFWLQGAQGGLEIQAGLTGFFNQNMFVSKCLYALKILIFSTVNVSKVHREEEEVQTKYEACCGFLFEASTYFCWEAQILSHDSVSQ